MRSDSLSCLLLLGALTVAAAATPACGSSGSADPASPGDPADGGPQVPATVAPSATTSPPGQAVPSLAVTLDHPVVTLRRGGSVDVTATLTKTRFDAPVEVKVSGLPAGVTLSPATVTVATGQTRATLHFTATPSAGGGAAMLDVTASAGTLAAHARLSLFVGDGGKLDPTFGTGGISILRNGNQYLAPSSVAVQTDAKILVGGGFDFTSARVPHGGVLRFTDVGAIDTTFGNAGLGLVPGLGSVSHMALQPDGAIVVCGSASDYRLVLARLTSAGVLDPTFGSAGLVERAASVASGCSGLGLDASGKITIASTASTDAVKHYENVVVARFTASGQPDPTFGDAGGMVSTSLGGISAFPTAFRLTAAGIFLGVSRMTAVGGAYDGIVTKLDLSGHLAAGFGSGGSYLTTYQAFDILPLPSGSLYYALQQQYFRLTAAGALDSAFGDAGKLANVDGFTYPFQVSTVDGGGTLYRFGYDGEPFFVGAVFAYLPDGTLDPGFGAAGKLDLHPDIVVDGSGITVGPDGRLVVVGGSGETVIYMARIIL